MTRVARGIADWVTRRVESVEGQPWGPGTIIGLLAAVIAVRNLLEVVVAKNPVFQGLAAFVHYPLAYLGPFVGLTLVLAIWGSVAPARVARLMCLAWFLTLLPPLADLLLHPGVEVPTIAYLQADPAELGTIWFRFFDPRAALVGTTVGIRFEALAAVALGAVYVALKSKRWWRAAGAAVSIYVVSLFFFSLPVLVTRFFQFFSAKFTLNDILRGESVLIRPDLDAAPDSAAILWLAPVLAGLALAWRGAEKHHADEALFGRPLGAPRLPGAGVFLLGPLYAGVAAAIRLHFPAQQALVWAPYDLLALVGAGIALTLLCAAARRLAPGDGPWAAWVGVAGLLVCSALGRSATLGLLVAAGVLVPFGMDLVPARWRPAALAAALPLGAFGAFAAGSGLVIGDEAIARMPFQVAASSVLTALGFGVLVGAGPIRMAWAAIPALGAAVGLGGLLTGGPRILLGAVPAGLLAGVVGWAYERFAGYVNGRRALAMALAFVVFVHAEGVLSIETLRDEWSARANCVPRLDVIAGQRFEGKGDWPAAQGLYSKALRCDESYVPALRALGLGLIRYRQDKVDEGLRRLEKAAELAPASPTELNNLAGAYLQLKRPADALPLLDRARAINGSELAVLFNRAQALEALGRPDKAGRAWQEYIDKATGRAEEIENVKLARQHLRAIQRGDRPRTLEPPSATPAPTRP